MPVTINGDGSIVGLAVGGLPDGSVDADTLAANAVTSGKLASNAVTTTKIANSAVTSVKTSGIGGLSMADIWRLSSGGTLGTDTITYFTSNWERADTYSSGQLGSGMTESSGNFTFPSTGIYQVTAMMQFKRNSGENRFADLNIQVTTDNSSYNTAAFGAASFAQNYSTNTAVANLFLDVTNVSTHKVRFCAYTNRSSILYLANSSSNACSFTFLKLGET